MQLDAAPRGVLFAEFRGRQIQVGRLEDRSVAIMAQLFMPRRDSVPQGLSAEVAASLTSMSTLPGGRYSNEFEVRSKNSGRKYSDAAGCDALGSRRDRWTCSDKSPAKRRR